MHQRPQLGSKAAGFAATARGAAPASRDTRPQPTAPGTRAPSPGPARRPPARARVPASGRARPSAPCPARRGGRGAGLPGARGPGARACGPTAPVVARARGRHLARATPGATPRGAGPRRGNRTRRPAGTRTRRPAGTRTGRAAGTRRGARPRTGAGEGFGTTRTGAGAGAPLGASCGAGGECARKSSGSRYACAWPARRTPKCRCGAATERRPLVPTAPSRAPAATACPFLTDSADRCR